MSLLFDFSRVLLFPKDTTYTGTLNGLYKSHRDEAGFSFFDYFTLNDELLDFLRAFRRREECFVFTSDVVQDDVVVRKEIDPIFAEVFSAKNLNIEKKDPTAYEKVTFLMRQAPSSVLFIDDAESNCAAAAAAGLRVHPYRSNELLLPLLSA